MDGSEKASAFDKKVRGILDSYGLQAPGESARPASAERHGTVLEGAARTGEAGGAKPAAEPASVPDRKIKDIRKKALAAYHRMGKKFSATFEENPSQASRNNLLALRKNQRLLIEGGIYTAKELDERVKELQTYLKESGNEGKSTMADMFNAWLNEKPKGKYEPQEA